MPRPRVRRTSRRGRTCAPGIAAQGETPLRTGRGKHRVRGVASFARAVLELREGAIAGGQVGDLERAVAVLEGGQDARHHHRGLAAPRAAEHHQEGLRLEAFERVSTRALRPRKKRRSVSVKRAARERGTPRDTRAASRASQRGERDFEHLLAVPIELVERRFTLAARLGGRGRHLDVERRLHTAACSATSFGSTGARSRNRPSSLPSAARICDPVSDTSARRRRAGARPDD